MASYSSGLNPAIVKTELDEVFFPSFNGRMAPGLATAETPALFNQLSIDRAAEIEEVFAGTGLWDGRSEEQDISQATPLVGNKITFNVVEFAQSVDIPKHMFDDDQHNTVNRMIADMGETGRITREVNAFAVYRNGFTTTLTADGSALFADAHTTLKGFTVDNKQTAVLAEPALNLAIVALAEQLAQDGTIRGHVPNCLLVPPALFKLACEILDSEFRSGVDVNDINVYSSKYGIMVYQSPFLGAAAGGSDTAWFLLAPTHSINRWVREPMTTALVDFKTQRNNNYIYKGWFREVYGAVSYEGTIGSDGTV